MLKLDRINSFIDGIVVENWETASNRVVAHHAGCSVQYANKILSERANRGDLARVRVAYKSTVRDVYTANQNAVYCVKALIHHQQKPHHVQISGIWYQIVLTTQNTVKLVEVEQ